MRTTILLDDQLGTKIKAQISGKQLSAFVNKCIREYFDRLEKKAQIQQLEKAYARAARKDKAMDDAVDVEDWPDWMPK